MVRRRAAAEVLISGRVGYMPGTVAHRCAHLGSFSQVKRLIRVWVLTAEYAVGTVAACAFAAVLYRVVTGSSIVTGLTDLVESALATLS
ncbi:Protein of unknown function [Blastococcus mobilis]|uniref:DUF4244 domain-containing protein n=1 Tax=Blastococcus mobilis TaxID=1938746 RepID=A0A238VXQ3_9ACTN|nr:Protein of unknown function [Blastococcus mobilis]